MGTLSKINSSLAPEKQSVIIAGPVRRVIYRKSENSFEILIVVSFGFFMHPRFPPGLFLG